MKKSLLLLILLIGCTYEAPTHSRPELCEMPVEISCEEWAFTRDRFELALINRVGTTIEDAVLEMEGDVTAVCEGPTTLQESQTVIFTCVPDEVSEENDIKLIFTYTEAGIKQQKLGSLFHKIKLDEVERFNSLE